RSLASQRPYFVSSCARRQPDSRGISWLSRTNHHIARRIAWAKIVFIVHLGPFLTPLLCRVRNYLGPRKERKSTMYWKPGSSSGTITKPSEKIFGRPGNSKRR